MTIPKYRAYLKKKNEIRSVISIVFEDSESGLSSPVKPPYVVVEGWCELFQLDDIILMQYTGLKDKNGVEIFEGDILHWTSEVVAREDWIGLVERINADFSVWTSKSARSSGTWLNTAHEYTEVIGDQYRHYYLIPELVE